MNHILQTALAWFGGINAFGYLTAAAWICTVSAIKSRGPKAKRAALRGRRTPLTEAEINAVDFDAELAKLTKENGR